MRDKELLPLLSPRSLPKSSRRRNWVVMALFCTVLVAIVLALLPVQLILANPLPVQSIGRQSHLQDRLGAVTSESDICSKIGIDLLKAGGNAADSVRCPNGHLSI
jgi:hypothetical protein